MKILFKVFSAILIVGCAATQKTKTPDNTDFWRKNPSALMSFENIVTVTKDDFDGKENYSMRPSVIIEKFWPRNPDRYALNSKIGYAIFFRFEIIKSKSDCELYLVGSYNGSEVWSVGQVEIKADDTILDFKPVTNDAQMILGFNLDRAYCKVSLPELKTILNAEQLYVRITGLNGDTFKRVLDKIDKEVIHKFFAHTERVWNSKGYKHLVRV